MTRKNSEIVILAVIVAVVSFLIYLPTLKSGFIYDDTRLLLFPWKVGENPYSFFIGGGIYYRPALHLSMAWDYSMWHLNPMGYHLTNISFHVFNSLLVFLAGFHLLKNILWEDKKALITAFSSAMLFALHPIHTESVAWISGRTDLLSTFFFLLAFLSYLIYERDGKTSALIMTGIFFLFSLFSKENAAALIPLALLYGTMNKMPKKKLLSSTGLFLLMLAIYIILRQGTGIKELTAPVGAGDVPPQEGTSDENFFHILFMGFGYYMEKLALPFSLNLLPELPKNPVYYAVSLVPFILGGVFYLKGKRLELFLTAWIVLTLTPSLSILFSQLTPMGERYLYLPSAGFSILIPAMIQKTGQKIRWKRLQVVLACLIFIIFAFASYDRLKAWGSDLAIWQDTVKKSPYSVNAHANLGSALLKTGKPDEAKKEFLFALEQKKRSYEQTSNILNHLGALELGKNNFEKSEQYLNEAIKTNPGFADSYNNLGVLYLKMSGSKDKGGHKQALLGKAIKSFSDALRAAPDFLAPRFNLGLCYLGLGDLDKAEAYFKSVIEADPQNELSAQSFNFLLMIPIAKSASVKDKGAQNPDEAQPLER